MNVFKKNVKKLRSRWHGDVFPFIDLIYRNGLSYFNNEMLCKQGTVEKTAEYKYHYRLHKLLNVKDIADNDFELVRMGRPHDGGYIVVRRQSDQALSARNIAYSLGICDDVSMDLDLAEKDYDIYQYDHTIKKLPVIHPKFHWKKIGITGGKETDSLKNLSSLIKANGHENQNGMFLKSDIEGFEWGMFKTCDETTMKQFDQIVVEMHDLLDFDKRPLILNTLKKINKTHQAVYVHPNNCTHVAFSGTLVTPATLEVTFVLKDKFTFKDSEKVFPTVLDQPNSTDNVDIFLGKWNVD